MKTDPPSTRARLLDLLRQGHALTQEEARERLGLTSTRQVRRLLRQLRERGVDIQKRRRDGQQVEYHLGSDDLYVEGTPIPLTEGQMLALAVAAEASRSTLAPTPLRGDLEDGLQALHQHMPGVIHTLGLDEQKAHWHFEEAPSAELDPEVFHTLTDAIDAQRTVRIDYLTASSGRYWTGRAIDPLLIAVRGGAWLCTAYCHEREALRDFNLAAIDRIAYDEDDPYFDPPEDFDPELYFRDRFSAVSGSEVHVVRLLVEPKQAEYFHRKQYHPTQHIEQQEDERDDGRLVVSYEVEGLDEVTSWIRSWGPGLRVLDPPDLIERIRQSARDTLARYED